LGQISVEYCRVSTSDQNYERHETDVIAFAAKAGYAVVGVWKETVSGRKGGRQQVLNLAQA
jgi:DNA invertase Pin-like site-specific DNA recombinase